jgi:hypothetical protein
MFENENKIYKRKATGDNTCRRQRKALFLKVDKFIHSEAFESAIENNTAVVSEFVENVLTANTTMEIRKLSTENPYTQPSDNTRINSIPRLESKDKLWEPPETK